MIKSLERGGPRPERKKKPLVEGVDEIDATNRGREQAESLHTVAEFRDLRGDSGELTEDTRTIEEGAFVEKDKRINPREASSREVARAQRVATNREILSADTSGNLPNAVRYEAGRTSERDRDLANRDMARAMVESRERAADKKRQLAETAWTMLRNGEMTKEAYDSLGISPETTENFQKAEIYRFVRNAQEMLRKGEITQKAFDLLGFSDKLLAETEDARLRAVAKMEENLRNMEREGGAFDWHMVNEDEQEVTPSVAEKKRRLQAALAERDKRLLADSDDKKHSA